MQNATKKRSATDGVGAKLFPLQVISDLGLIL